MKYHLKHYSSLDSTNSLALEYAQNGAKEGLVITADFQKKGRGKPGNTWVSPRGKNLLTSVLFRPKIKASRAPYVTQIACRSIARVLKEHYGIESTFKRPNDILVGGKKICGVLTEASSSAAGDVKSIVVGFGLNVNSEASELLKTATSMKTILGRSVQRHSLLESILTQLGEDIRDL